MADVRGASGAPSLANFGGDRSPTPSTPLYVDLATGDLYVVISEVPTKVGSISADSNLVITQQVFANHAKPQADFGDVSTHLSNAAFERVIVPVRDLADAQEIMAKRVFSQPVAQSQVVMGTADSFIQNMVFAPKRVPAMWS